VLAALNPEHLDVLLCGVTFHTHIMPDENGGCRNTFSVRLLSAVLR
jgi:hypothetical protein